MVHKHHSTHHIVAVLLGIALIGGIIGGAGALLGEQGKTVVERVDALRIQALYDRVKQRRMRRQKRLQRSERVVADVGRTYPMQTSTLLRDNLSRKWEVALHTGFLYYPALRISVPIGKPSLTYWENRNWRGLENQMQFGLL